MAEITQEEAARIEALRGKGVDTDPMGANFLKAIYNQHSGHYLRSCLCNTGKRRQLYNTFFAWYDERTEN